MEQLTRLHANLLFTILLVFIALALWGLIGYLSRAPISHYVGALLIIGELLIASTFVIGMILWSGNMRPSRPEPHLMYAVVAILSPLVMLADLRSNSGRAAQLRLLIGAVFVCAIVLRALVTGR